MNSSDGKGEDAPNPRCRVCLAADVRMQSVGNHHHLEVFEKLTSRKLNTEDGLPLTICYICYSQLQRCCKFTDMYHKSDKILKELLHGGNEAVQVPMAIIAHNLTSTPIQYMSITDYSNKNNADESKIKKEITAAEEFIDNEERTLCEDFTDNDNSMYPEQSPMNVKTEPDLVNFDEVAAAKTGLENINKFVTLKTNTNQVYALAYTCSFCENTYFATKEELKQHNTQIHFINNSQTYECTICHRPFVNKCGLNVHMKTHAREKSTCNICNKTFTRKRCMETHLESHTKHKKPHPCNICNMTFTQKGYLENHVKSHTNYKDKPYPCNICNRGFGQYSSWRTHIKKEHLPQNS